MHPLHPVAKVANLLSGRLNTKGEYISLNLKYRCLIVVTFQVEQNFS